MNEKLFDQRDSELPEVFIFENYYQVNLKHNKLISPAPNLYPSLELADFKASETVPGSIEGFYDATKGTVLDHPESLNDLPPNIYMVRLPGPQQLDAEGFARLHEDPELFDYRTREQKWDCHVASILFRKEALALLDQLKDRQQLNTPLGKSLREQEKAVQKENSNSSSRQAFRIKQDRHAGRRSRRL